MMKKSMCLAVLLVIVVLAGSSWAQVIAGVEAAKPKAAQSPFLRKQEVEGYLNYGQDEYKNYKEELDVDKRYDFLGNFLMEGYEIFKLEETRPSPAGSSIEKHAYYSDWFNSLLISKDSYRGWSTMLTVGDNIRSKFTSLTLKVARFNGVRWDAASTKNKFTVLATRGYPNNFSNPAAAIETRPIYVFGTHWQTQLGDVLRLGATYVNQHRVNTKQSSSNNTLRGRLPESMDSFYPDEILVRVEDDSPRKTPTTGAAVFRAELTVRTDADSSVTLWITPTGQSDPGGRITSSFSRPPKKGFWEASGREYVEFVFPLSLLLGPDAGSPTSCEIALLVANDYCIKVGHRYLYALGEVAETRTVPYETVVRADGEVRDFSNKKAVSFPYGLTTGQSMFGVDFEASLIGLTVGGEYANNSIYSKFPFGAGEEITDESSAYFVNVTKDVGPVKLGWEYFHIGPEFGGGFDATRGGGRFYTDDGEYKIGKTFPTQEFPLVEDNDDNDQWPDDSNNDFPSANTQDKGVFPGLDEDNDGIADDDRNTNGIADYTEPFLMYYVDPTEFVYGDDLNNNGEIDTRENDNKPDYPYDRDTGGYHYFGTLQPMKGMYFTLGHYNMDEIAGRGSAKSTYGKVEYLYSVPKFGELVVQHDTKRVRDTIPNDIYPIEVDPKTSDGSVSDPYDTDGRDPMDFENSMANTSYIGTRYSQVPNLNIINNFLLKVNSKHDTNDRMTSFTEVGKVDYTLNLGKLTIQPMFKYLGLRVKQRNLVEKDWLEKWYETAPILRVNYKITSKTVLQIGQQGFGTGKQGFRRVFSNRVNVEEAGSSGHESLKRSITLVMLSNSSDYWGYKIAANVGLLRTVVDYDEKDKASDDYSQIFVKIVCGY